MVACTEKDIRSVRRHEVACLSKFSIASLQMATVPKVEKMDAKPDE